MTESTLPLRALLLFTALPDGHQTFKVENDNSGVHLRPGEYAVVDKSDRDLQHGELYLIEYPSGRHKRQIMQARGRMSQITPLPSPRQEAWYICHLAGFRRTADAPIGGIPVFAGLADGPYRPAQLRERVVGRVVGYSETALGKRIRQLQPDY